MGKKGQITIFIIIAIVIVSVTILFFMLNKTEIESMSVNVQNIHSYTENCIIDSAEKVFEKVGDTGGYYNVPENSIEGKIPYYFIENSNTMPSLEILEREISKYMEREIFFCTKNFIDFPEEEITTEDIEVKTTIDPEQIIFDVEYPLTISDEESVIKIEDFENIKINYRYGVIINSIRNLIDASITSEDVCITCAMEILEEEDLYMDINAYDEETTIIIIRDENLRTYDLPFEIKFAIEQFSENE